MAHGWRTHIPDRLGDLPLGGDLIRTDPGGPADAGIVILGVYPALTKMGRFQTADGPINLPIAVERTSFDPGSSSGKKIDDAYLTPLGLARADVLLTDMFPYFLANTAASGKRGRSMWHNVQTYERLSGQKTAVEPRPSPEELLHRSRSMPGNRERLAEQINEYPRRLLLTLGNEAAAFVRSDSVAKDAQSHLLMDPTQIRLGGCQYRVIHLPHPGIVMRSKEWRQRLHAWIRNVGRHFVQAAR